MHKFHYEEPHGTLKSSNFYCVITTNTFYVLPHMAFCLLFPLSWLKTNQMCEMHITCKFLVENETLHGVTFSIWCHSLDWPMVCGLSTSLCKTYKTKWPSRLFLQKLNHSIACKTKTWDLKHLPMHFNWIIGLYVSQQKQQSLGNN